MNIADMTAFDQWQTERGTLAPSAADLDFDMEIGEWVCPDCDMTEGCITCTPPF